ncbi:hypothetical protein F8388_025605 [Cannabis sativa]|uniref:Uncharacterized protein n=1 Tax=Cannabis sativa TaxID=3483 RepID=A0A7J6G160_CANSA|nr:hypothetical protein F8388_025605 [Cannabis sativa]
MLYILFKLSGHPNLGNQPTNQIIENGRRSFKGHKKPSNTGSAIVPGSDIKKKRDKLRNPHFPLPDLSSLNNQAHISNSFLSSF